jgi:hypothetical protein
MRKRRLVLALVAVALLAGAGGVALNALCARPCVTPERCGRIRPGMTLDEVVAILGCPPGNHSAFDGFTTDFFWRTNGTSGGCIPAEANCYDWFVDCQPPQAHEEGFILRHLAIVIRVRLDDRGRVSDIHSDDRVWYSSLPPFGRVKLWLWGVASRLGF